MIDESPDIYDEKSFYFHLILPTGCPSSVYIGHCSGLTVTYFFQSRNGVRTLAYLSGDNNKNK